MGFDGTTIGHATRKRQTTQENTCGCLIVNLYSLFLQEFKCRAEVLLRVPRVAHDAVHLVGERAERRGGLGAGGRVLRQPQVLRHQRRAEPALVVVTGYNTIKH